MAVREGIKLSQQKALAVADKQTGHERERDLPQLSDIL